MPAKPATPKKESRPARTKAARTVVPGDQAQAHLLEAAMELFQREGIHAVGVDAVVKRAGVNKMCLYRQFASKDELILAYLKRQDEACLARLDQSIACRPGEPRRQLEQIFIDLAQRASSPDYRGCPFINVAAEFPERDHPARKLVAANKAALVSRLTALVEALPVSDPTSLVNTLALLVEGAYAASQTFGAGNSPLATLPTVAAQLIDAAIASSAPAVAG